MQRKHANELFTGARYAIGNAPLAIRAVSGDVYGTGSTSLLDPVYIFKGKLRAAATRAKFHDSADLRWLEAQYSDQLRANVGQFNLQYIGLALKRYPELELMFARIGVNVTAAKQTVAQLNFNQLPAPAPGDVHRGILG